MHARRQETYGAACGNSVRASVESRQNNRYTLNWARQRIGVGVLITPSRQVETQRVDLPMPCRVAAPMVGIGPSSAFRSFCFSSVCLETACDAAPMVVCVVNAAAPVI
jgi:hypothetical protein